MKKFNRVETVSVFTHAAFASYSFLYAVTSLYDLPLLSDRLASGEIILIFAVLMAPVFPLCHLFSWLKEQTVRAAFLVGIHSFFSLMTIPAFLL